MEERRASHELRAQAAPPLRGAHVGLVAAGVVACTFVLALAVGGVHNRVGTPPAAPDLSVVVDYLIVAFIAAGGVVALVLMLVGRARERAEDDLDETAPPLSKGVRVTAVLVMVALLAAEFWAIRQLYGGGRSQSPQPAQPATTTATSTGTDTAGGADSTQPVHWSGLALLVAAVLVAVLVLVFARARREPVEPDGAGALADAVAGGIDDLESEPDPRRAVIKAYSRMEQALAAEGLPRRVSET